MAVRLAWCAKIVVLREMSGIEELMPVGSIPSGEFGVVGGVWNAEVEIAPVNPDEVARLFEHWLRGGADAEEAEVGHVGVGPGDFLRGLVGHD